MSERTLEVRLRDEADTLRPETLRVRDLADIATLVEQTVIEAVGGDLEPADDGAVLVSLTAIEEGSTRLVLSLAATAAVAVADIKRAVSEGTYSKLPVKCQRKLAELSQRLAGKGWQAELSGVSPGRVVISASHPVPAPDRKTARSKTTIYGVCVRVGGETPKASIRLLTTGKQLTIDLTEDLARELGNRLYDLVGIEGMATVEASTWEMIAFRGVSLTPYRGKKADPLAATLKVARESGDVWSGVDPVEYVRGLREEADGT